MPLSAPPHSGSSPRLPRILIVDDDPVVRRGLRRLLNSARPGWKIDSADNAASALELVSARAYDVVITDLHMPATDGIMLLDRLKTEQPSLMRVIHSSHVESLNEEPDGEVAHAVLPKPCRPDEIVNVLDWALDQRRRRLRDSANF